MLKTRSAKTQQIKDNKREALDDAETIIDHQLKISLQSVQSTGREIRCTNEESKQDSTEMLKSETINPTSQTSPSALISKIRVNPWIEREILRPEPRHLLIARPSDGGL
jgi:hypothetical protein